MPMFLFLSYLFGILTTNAFIHSPSSLENHALFQTNWSIPIFKPKRPKTHTLWGSTDLSDLYKEDNQPTNYRFINRMR